MRRHYASRIDLVKPLPFSTGRAAFRQLPVRAAPCKSLRPTDRRQIREGRADGNLQQKPISGRCAADFGASRPRRSPLGWPSAIAATVEPLHGGVAIMAAFPRRSGRRTRRLGALRGWRTGSGNATRPLVRLEILSTERWHRIRALHLAPPADAVVEERAGSSGSRRAYLS